MSKFKLSACAVAFSVLAAFGVSGAASAAAPEPVRGGLVHPCDVKPGTKHEKSTERLCLRVWGQWEYSWQFEDGSVVEIPAGPTVVDGFRQDVEWYVANGEATRAEAEQEFRRLLTDERTFYVKHIKPSEKF